MTFLQMDAQAVREALDWPSLIDALDALFRDGCEAPPRHHHQISRVGQPDATLLLMPAWASGAAGVVGVKLVTVFPGNATRGLPSISGSYVVFDGETGELRAILDGGELTARRTAAASALASRYLSREDSRVLSIIGAGRLALNLAAAHASVRPIEEALLWARDLTKAEEACRRIATDLGLPVRTAELSEAVSAGDIVTAATLSDTALILGEQLKPGAHVDLVGAFKPSMRESDDETMRRASAVVVDTYAGALAEGGDVVQALESGALERSKIRAEMAELARGEVTIDRRANDITVFKSVGAALEDLAAAQLCVARGPW